MAIPNEKVKKIQTITIEIGELIKGMNPVKDKEWDAFNKMVDARKNLAKIDTDSLLQGDFDDLLKGKGKAKARKDCPRCGGAGKWIDPQDSKHRERPCNCNEVGDIPWPAIKKEWEEALAPAKA